MKQSIENIQLILDKMGGELSVLEAGCGSASHVNFGPNANIIGIDMSEKQLKRNPDLSEKIVGDIQNYPLPDAKYDVVVCWYVLEHVQNPEMALQNMFRSVKKGGIVILALPNFLSLKGVITKYSPFWFHVWVYKYINKNPLAGKDDNAPFPTPFKLILSPNKLMKFALQSGFSVEYFRIAEFKMKALTNNRFFELIWDGVNWLTKLLTIGKMNFCSNYFIVLKK